MHGVPVCWQVVQLEGDTRRQWNPPSRIPRNGAVVDHTLGLRRKFDLWAHLDVWRHVCG